MLSSNADLVVVEHAGNERFGATGRSLYAQPVSTTATNAWDMRTLGDQEAPEKSPLRQCVVAKMIVNQTMTIVP